MKWNIPTVLTSDEILDKAFHAAGKIRPASIRDRQKPRNIYLAKVGAVSGVIQSKLTSYIKKFPSINQLEVLPDKNTKQGFASFYYDLFDLTFGVDRMKKSLGALNWVVRKTRELDGANPAEAGLPTSCREQVV